MPTLARYDRPGNLSVSSGTGSNDMSLDANNASREEKKEKRKSDRHCNVLLLLSARYMSASREMTMGDWGSIA